MFLLDPPPREREGGSVGGLRTQQSLNADALLTEFKVAAGSNFFILQLVQVLPHRALVVGLCLHGCI